VKGKGEVLAINLAFIPFVSFQQGPSSKLYSALPRFLVEACVP
jgi:hypothetical protein